MSWGQENINLNAFINHVFHLNVIPFSFNSNGVFLQQVIHFRLLITSALCRNANICMTGVTSGQFLFCDGHFETGLQWPVLEKIRTQQPSCQDLEGLTLNQSSVHYITIKGQVSIKLYYRFDLVWFYMVLWYIGKLSVISWPSFNCYTNPTYPW